MINRIIQTKCQRSRIHHLNSQVIEAVHHDVTTTGTWNSIVINLKMRLTYFVGKTFDSIHLVDWTIYATQKANKQNK